MRMAYNTRRGGGGNLQDVGTRRNMGPPPPVGHNFVAGGQLAPHQGQVRPQKIVQQGQVRPQQPPQQGQVRLQQGQVRPQLPPQQGQVRPNMTPPSNGNPKNVAPKPQNVQQNVQNVAIKTQPPSPSSTPVPTPAAPEKMVTNTPEEESAEKKKFWMKTNRISKKERQRRRNIRLSKILQPKNAVMILNEMISNLSFEVFENVQNVGDMQKTYTATVFIEGIPLKGNGRSKMEAKNQAAEEALKYIVKSRPPTVFKQEPEDSPDAMEVTEEGGATSPIQWQQFASFALYKLLTSWGEDCGLPRKPGAPVDPMEISGVPKPAKKLPANAANINPVQLLNQMMPHVQFEITSIGQPPSMLFHCKSVVDGVEFTGQGGNKKKAKRDIAFKICSQILGVKYPPEALLEPNNPQGGEF